MKGARGYYEQALAVAQEAGDRTAAASILGNIGNAYFSEYRALGLAQEVGDPHAVSSQLTNLGSAFQRLGEPGRAATFYRQALPMLEAIQSPHADTIRRWLASQA